MHNFHLIYLSIFRHFSAVYRQSVPTSAHLSPMPVPEPDPRSSENQPASARTAPPSAPSPHAAASVPPSADDHAVRLCAVMGRYAVVVLCTIIGLRAFHALLPCAAGRERPHRPGDKSPCHSCAGHPRRPRAPAPGVHAAGIPANQVHRPTRQLHSTLFPLPCPSRPPVLPAPVAGTTPLFPHAPADERRRAESSPGHSELLSALLPQTSPCRRHAWPAAGHTTGTGDLLCSVPITPQHSSGPGPPSSILPVEHHGVSVLLMIPTPTRSAWHRRRACIERTANLHRQ